MVRNQTTILEVEEHETLDVKVYQACKILSQVLLGAG